MSATQTTKQQISLCLIPQNDPVKHTTNRAVYELQTKDSFVVNRIYHQLKNLEVELLIEVHSNGTIETVQVAVDGKNFVKLEPL